MSLRFDNINIDEKSTIIMIEIYKELTLWFSHSAQLRL